MRMLAFVVAKIGKFLVVFFVPLFPKRKTALMAEFDILFFHFLKHSFLDIRYPFFRQGVLPDSLSQRVREQFEDINTLANSTIGPVASRAAQGED